MSNWTQGVRERGSRQVFALKQFERIVSPFTDNIQEGDAGGGQVLKSLMWIGLKEDVIYIYINMYIYMHMFTQTHTYKSYYSAIKKNERMPFKATWMDRQRKTTIICDHSYVEYKKKHRSSHYGIEG